MAVLDIDDLSAFKAFLLAIFQHYRATLCAQIGEGLIGADADALGGFCCFIGLSFRDLQVPFDRVAIGQGQCVRLTSQKQCRSCGGKGNY